MSNDKVLLYESDLITLHYWADKKMIHHVVHRPTAESDVSTWIEGMNKGSDAVKKYGISKWFSDDRKNGPVPQAIIDWGASDFNVRTVNNGWKYWANVVPEDLVAAGTYIPLIQMFHDLGVRMQVFTTPEKAIAWLDTLD